MRFKDLLLPMVLALATTWLIQHFVLDRFFGTPGSTTAQAGKSFKAPTSPQELKPLNLEVDFIDTKRPKKEVETVLETPHATYEFSSDGASLERLTFKRQLDGKMGSITTLFPSPDGEREDRLFLVALDQKTPYYFELTNLEQNDAQFVLTYQADFGDGVMTKVFTVYKDSYKIDLALTIAPKAGVSVEPRILYRAPFMADIADTDTISALVTDEKGNVQKINRDTLDPQQGWFAPSLAGLENRYFVYSLTNDAQKFVQRAYFKFNGKKSILGILEGHTITEPTTWHLSFYVGPKEEAQMVKVDKRLEQTLDYYGWFAPISRVMLAILKFIFSYVHNYGFAIILLTLLISLLLLPLTIRGEKSMKQRMEMQKKLQYLQQRYKHEPELLAQEKAELIRKHGMPELVGCLPLLLQLPLFIALSRVLSNAIELYHAPFILWVKDLSSKDPYYGLPLLLGASMLGLALLEDPKQRTMMIVVACVFTAFTASFSAGLCLYILASTIFRVVQRAVQRRPRTA